MSDFDLIIRSSPDLGIAEGKFAAIGPHLAGSAREEIDATQLLVMPGVIDAHVHFNEPGRTEWEGFATGSRAAAAGGTTTFFDMPLNAHPPTLDGPSFDLKRAAAEASSLVDFALWGGLVPANLDQLEVLQQRGVIGLKAFMSESGIADFPRADLSTLRTGMERAARLGLLVAVHAEFDHPEWMAGTSVRDYCRSRPVLAELQAIESALDLAAHTGCALHVVHVSSGRGVALIAEARTRGVDVTCETCPHYLLLTEDDMERLGAVVKCAPPLRDLAEQTSLCQQVRAGHVTTIGSDHSPASPTMKRDANFFKVWGGISGCQHLLPLLLDAGFAPALLQDLLSAHVAERFHLAPQKGRIAIGADADCVLIDPEAEHLLIAGELHYRHRQSPYLGRTIRPRVLRTISRGETVYRENTFPSQTRGRLLRPSGD